MSRLENILHALIFRSYFEHRTDLIISKNNHTHTYCIKTAQEYVRNYGWYKMPSSVHRVLIHGADIIRVSVIAVGTLSEEPQECRNKDIKKFREYRARKCSR